MARHRPLSLLRGLSHACFHGALLDEAAQLAFYLLFAIFPFLILLVSLLAFLPIPNLAGHMLSALTQVAPREALALLEEPIRQVVSTPRGEVVFASLFASLLFASSGTSALMYALNRAYRVVDPRPWWRMRLWAVLLTALAGLLAIASMIGFFLGPSVLHAIATLLGLGVIEARAWALLRWPMVLLGAMGALALLYFFLPALELPLRRVVPGAVMGALLWLLSSLGFSLYVENLGVYDRTYGSLAGGMVLLLWIYLSSLSVLLGAELNVLLSEESGPSSKHPPEGPLAKADVF